MGIVAGRQDYKNSIFPEKGNTRKGVNFFKLMKPTDGFYDAIKEHIDSQWRQDYFKVCDLLLDAYLMGFNNALLRGRNPDINDTGAQEALEELVKEVGLDPKIVLRRLYCPQQIEENGECKCD